MSNAVKRARKSANERDEGEKTSENAGFMSLAYKTLLDPNFQDYQRSKDLKKMDNSTPPYVNDILEASLPNHLCNENPSLIERAVQDT